MLDTSGDLLEHWPTMVRVAQSVLRSRADAEECAASAIAQVVAQARLDVENYEAYLVTVVKRRALDMRRAHGRAWRRTVRYASHEEVSAADIAEDVVARAEAVWADTAARRLLSPRVYRLLQMVGDGVPTSQIALELGLTSRAVESHLLRARRVMRAALAHALALLGALGFALRRIFVVSAPTTAAAAAVVLLVTAPSLRTWSPWSPGASQELTVASPHSYELPMRHPSIRKPSISLRAARPARGGTSASRRLRPSQTGSRSRVATLQGPAHASATVTAGDSGTHEDTPLQMIVACARRFRVSSEHIGC